MNMYQGLFDMFCINGIPSDDYFVYETQSLGLDRLLEKYPLKQIAGEGTDYEKAYAIMEWIYDHLVHQPDYCNSEDDNAITLLDRLMEGKPINCRAVAIIMTECFLALGIKSRVVWLLSVNPYDMDCHVVPIAYCKELKKWIMFDATVHTTVMNKDGEPLSLLETRDYLARGEELTFSEKLRYVRGACPYATQKKMFEKYLSKNLFMMKTYKINCFGFEKAEGQEIVHLVSSRFDIERYYELQKKYWEEMNHDIAG